MNIVRHRIYQIELDVWEPLQKLAELEIDEVFRKLRGLLLHSGNVRITLVSEERL